MKTKRLFALLVPFLIASAPALAAPDEFEIEALVGGAYYDDYTDEFLYCAMGAEYHSGLDLIFSLTPDGYFAINLANDEWALDPGASYRVDIWVDQIDLGQQWGEVVDEDLISITFDYDPWLIDVLRRGRELGIETAQEIFYFELTNSYEALPRLERCLDLSLALLPGAHNPFETFSSSRDNPFAYEGQDYTTYDPYEPLPPNQEDIEAIEAVLYLAGLEDYWYVATEGRDDLFSDADHSWTNGETVGAMYIFPDAEGLELSEVVAAYFTVTEEYCDGIFSYGVQDVFISYDTPARRAFGRCETYDGTVVLPSIIWQDGPEITIVTHASDERAVESAAEADEKFFRFVQAIYQEEFLYEEDAGY